MDKYEYMVLLLDSDDSADLEFHLNLWGDYGWELCQIDPGNRVIVKRLKRPSVDDIGSTDEL